METSPFPHLPCHPHQHLHFLFFSDITVTSPPSPTSNTAHSTAGQCRPSTSMAVVLQWRAPSQHQLQTAVARHYIYYIYSCSGSSLVIHGKVQVRALQFYNFMHTQINAYQQHYHLHMPMTQFSARGIR